MVNKLPAALTGRALPIFPGGRDPNHLGMRNVGVTRRGHLRVARRWELPCHVLSVLARSVLSLLQSKNTYVHVHRGAARYCEIANRTTGEYVVNSDNLSANWQAKTYAR